MFEDEVIADVKALANGYAAGHGTKGKPLKLKTVSLRMYGHAEVLPDFIRKKRSATTGKLQEMYKNFRADWPEGVPFPELKHLR